MLQLYLNLHTYTRRHMHVFAPLTQPELKKLEYTCTVTCDFSVHT